MYVEVSTLLPRKRELTSDMIARLEEKGDGRCQPEGVLQIRVVGIRRVNWDLERSSEAARSAPLRLVKREF